MSHKIGDATYTTQEIDDILSGTHDDLVSLSSEEYMALQDAALLAMESIDERTTWTSLTFEQAMEEE